MEYKVWHQLLTTADFILFFLFMCAVGYLFIFAIFSFKNQKVNFKKTNKKYRFLILFTAHKIDENIYKSLDSFYNQDFPDQNFDIAIAAGKVSDSAEKEFDRSPVTLIKSPGDERFRSGILEYTLQKIHSEYDIIVIMKAGNTVDPNFLEEINKAYHSGVMAVQTHFTSKNLKTSTAILNALSQEINNSIFRRGHVNLGFSAGLIGSGMAFNYEWFRKNISKVKKNGLTKQLETLLLRQGIFIEYLENIYTYDERKRSSSKSSGHRQHWYSAKFYSLGSAITELPKAFLAGNFDFCDKIIQWIIPSRFFLLFTIGIISIVLIFIDWTLCLKWFGLLFVILLVFDLSIPTKFHNSRTFFALFSLPILYISNFINYFRIVKK